MTTGRDDVHVRAAALLADKYADPWLKLARYEVLTDDLLDRLDEAVNYLRRVVQADRDDAKMGYPIPGDSCLAACIGLEVMRFLDEIGALTERSVADANGSTSGGIPAQVGTDRSVSAPDLDAWACTKRYHVVPGGIREPLDTRMYRCACGLVLMSGIGTSEIRFGLVDRLYPDTKEGTA